MYTREKDRQRKVAAEGGQRARRHSKSDYASAPRRFVENEPRLSNAQRRTTNAATRPKSATRRDVLRFRAMFTRLIVTLPRE